MGANSWLMASVLLVDDDKVARAMYSDALRAGGHSVETAGSFAEARARLVPGRFDAVVTDLVMQGGDGMEVLRHVKEKCEGTEVVVVTAVDRVEPAVRAIKSGAAEYLVKPVAPEALLHALSRAMTTRSLLRENEELREHLRLSEAAARLSTSLDRGQLGAAAASALVEHARAKGVLILEAGGARFLGLVGLEKELASSLAASAPAELPAAVERDGANVQWVASKDDTGLQARIALWFEAPADERALKAANFLARHLATGLRNAGRLAAIEDLAYLDDLTHLFNARYLRLVLARELSVAREANLPLSLLFLDLDGFKSINDTHGHLVGSQLLVEVARVLRGCVRDQDTLVRYGGDEYVVLLRRSDSKGALMVAERIRATLAAHRFLSREGLALTLTTCVGVASFPEHADSEEDLLELADRAMYLGKRSTKNAVSVAREDVEPPPPERQVTLEP
jgi:two-component system cell cycle response regulator